MALTDILRQRVQQAQQTLQLDCGELGVLTVEALTLRECALLSAGSEPDRSILYAACRELQRTGETLQQEGRVFRPEDITLHISDEEAALAAQAILALSGWGAAPPAEKKPVPETTAVDLTEQPAAAERPPSGSAPDLLLTDVSAPSSDFSGSGISSRPMAVDSLPNLPLQSATKAHSPMTQRGLSRSEESASAEVLLPRTPADTFVIPEQRNPAADSFARALLAGLKRAAAVR